MRSQNGSQLPKPIRSNKPGGSKKIRRQNYAELTNWSTNGSKSTKSAGLISCLTSGSHLWCCSGFGEAPRTPSSLGRALPPRGPKHPHKQISAAICKAGRCWEPLRPIGMAGHCKTQNCQCLSNCHESSNSSTVLCSKMSSRMHKKCLTTSAWTCLNKIKQVPLGKRLCTFFSRLHCATITVAIQRKCRCVCATWGF